MIHAHVEADLNTNSAVEENNKGTILTEPSH